MAPARDADGKLVLLLVDEDTGKHTSGRRTGSSRSQGVAKVGDRQIRRRGLRRSSRAGAARARPQLAAFTVPTQRRQGDPGRGSANRRRARADAALRHRSEDSSTRIEDGIVFTRQRARARFTAVRPGARAGLEDERRLATSSKIIHEPTRPRAVPARLRLDVRLRVLGRA